MQGYKALGGRIFTLPFLILSIVAIIGIYFMAQRFMYGMGDGAEYDSNRDGSQGRRWGRFRSRISTRRYAMLGRVGIVATRLDVAIDGRDSNTPVLSGIGFLALLDVQVCSVIVFPPNANHLALRWLADLTDQMVGNHHEDLVPRNILECEESRPTDRDDTSLERDDVPFPSLGTDSIDPPRGPQAGSASLCRRHKQSQNQR